MEAVILDFGFNKAYHSSENQGTPINADKHGFLFTAKNDEACLGQSPRRAGTPT